MTPTSFNCRNITISGLPGGGSTTLLRLVEKELGWKAFSGGEFMRQYALENGYLKSESQVHHDATIYPADFDRKVDYGVREKLQETSQGIYEAWLTGFFAQGVPGVLKILVTCSEDSVRIDRVVNRDRVTVEEAKKHILGREQKNLKKWQQMYSQEWQDWVVSRGIVSPSDPINFWDERLYDLVIDTYSMSREESLEKVVAALVK